MLGAVSLVVVLDDVSDAHKPLLARPDVLQQGGEVAVHLRAAALQLVMVVGVRGDQGGDDFVGDQIVPVDACYGGAVGEANLCLCEVAPALFEEVLDLWRRQRLLCAVSCLWPAYRVVLERCDRLCR